MARDFIDLINYRYGDRGGYKDLMRLCSAELPYELKLKNIQEQFRVSRQTASLWYSKWKQLEGVASDLSA